MATHLLAVDTATEICGVALVADGQVKAELILNSGVTHTRSVMAAIESILDMNKMDIQDIDAFAVTRGPGGFTGLRIGISTVKGLALAASKPIFGISSLEVLAYQAPGDAVLICPLIDARRHELYWTLYRRQDNVILPVLEERVGPVADVIEKIGDSCQFIGNGAVHYRSSIQKLLTKPAKWANDELNGIRPSVLAMLAWKRMVKGKFDDIRNFSPVYLRKSDAELARKA